MGQTQSQSHTISDVYAAYIQQQQNLIFQQQSQINALYSHSIQQDMTRGTSRPSYHPSQTQQIPQQSHRQPLPQLPAAPSYNKPKLDPYQILGLSKSYTKSELKRAYLKAAMKAHPDRGGSPQAFQKVSIAYTVLTNKLKEKENSHSHQELRQGARDYIQTQESKPMRNVNMKENFDAELFNKIYEENKIPDSFDRGYGDWMQQNPALESGQTKMFQNGFNKDMFNATFDSYKRDNASKYKQALVKYDEPEQRLSMKNQDALVTLGRGKVSDFSGTSDGLHYTDYKKAYTHGATLIDASSVSLDDRAQSIGGVKAQRSNLSYQMSAQDQERLAKQQYAQQREEQKRMQRLQTYDQKHGDAYERIHGLLLR